MIEVITAIFESYLGVSAMLSPLESHIARTPWMLRISSDRIEHRSLNVPDMIGESTGYS